MINVFIFPVLLIPKWIPKIEVSNKPTAFHNILRKSNVMTQV